MKSTQERIDEVFALYEQYGNQDYIGEPVSQLEHMSQAAQMAIKEGFDDEVVLAAFFHDIGHICTHKRGENDMNGFGIKSHESVGSLYLQQLGFSKKVTDLIESHVAAKRYLTFVDPAYYHHLSEASKKTLEYQGGVMTVEEARQFESRPYFKESIRLRRWDELAKEKDIPVIDLEILKEKAKKHLQ